MACRSIAERMQEGNKSDGVSKNTQFTTKPFKTTRIREKETNRMSTEKEIGL
jgi:hypothetical protein